jgi:hypothetical protein
VEQFQFALKKNPQNKLLEESLKLAFFRGVNEDCMDALNLIGQEDISQKSFEEIFRVYRSHSRNSTKRPREDKTFVLNKSSNRASKIEINNLLSNMKEDIIIHLET